MCVYDVANGHSLQMFVFGTKSLEQFVDRLIEWPQYCNHILQISHLRVTHTELVAFIERALARISSGHLETDGTNNASAAHHHGLLQAASANVEVRFFSLVLFVPSPPVSCIHIINCMHECLTRLPSEMFRRYLTSKFVESDGNQIHE